MYTCIHVNMFTSIHMFTCIHVQCLQVYCIYVQCLQVYLYICTMFTSAQKYACMYRHITDTFLLYTLYTYMRLK